MADNPLEAAARAALTTHHTRAIVFTHDGRRYVVKRLAAKPRRLLQTLFARWLVKRLTGQPLPLQTLALDDAAYSMDFEASRLHALADAGVRVPQVVLQTADFFVLDYCGSVVSALLESWTPDIWRRELLLLATELGEFHQAGHWHGGAQIKNITRLDDCNYRIDFEENFGHFLPLTVTQAADLMLFLNSISLAGPIDEQEARQLLPQLIIAYFAAHPEPEIRRVIQRTVPLMRGLARFAGLFRRWSNKGIRRLQIMVDVLTPIRPT